MNAFFFYSYTVFISYHDMYHNQLKSDNELRPTANRVQVIASKV